MGFETKALRLETDALPPLGIGEFVDYRYNPSIIPGIVAAVDVTAIALSAIFCSLVFHSIDLIYFDMYVSCVIFVAVLYYFVSMRANLFGINVIMRPMARADDVIVSIATAMMIMFSMVLALDPAERISRIWAMQFLGVSAVTMLTGRLAARWVFERMWRRGLIGRNVVILGAGEQSRRFLRRLGSARPFFTSVAGVFGDKRPEGGDSFEGYPVLGDADDLLRRVRERRIDDVVIAMPWNADQEVAATVERLKELPVNVYLSTDLVGFELNFQPAMGNLISLPMFEVVQRPISGWSAALKTIEDYVLAGVGLIAISPLMLLIAIAIKIDSPGPVFFMQKRLGFNNREFSIYKFRSMHHAAIPERAVRQASRGDPRVTRVGRFIRSTSLDELPQLFNVLNGSMSIVGPRPHALSHNEEYGRQIRGYFARHRVKPGITGWAQVNGFRGETDTVDKMEQRIRHDIYYADNWSLLFDIKILVMTVIFVFFQKNAY